MRRVFKYLAIAAVVFLIAAQFARPDRTNPPINPALTFETVAHPSPEMASILKRACYDCHSHGTVWPWYSQVAPASWLLADDVKEGREHLNFSEWGLLRPQTVEDKLQDVCKEVKEGEMPLWQYLLIHRESRLTQNDIVVLCTAAAGPDNAWEKGKK